MSQPDKQTLARDRRVEVLSRWRQEAPVALFVLRTRVDRASASQKSSPRWNRKRPVRRGQRELERPKAPRSRENTHIMSAGIRATGRVPGIEAHLACPITVRSSCQGAWELYPCPWRHFTHPPRTAASRSSARREANNVGCFSPPATAPSSQGTTSCGATSRLFSYYVRLVSRQTDGCLYIEHGCEDAL